MKMTRKLVIASLAVLTGATVAGSVTSTVAWFQYVTRAQIAYTGTTSHCSKLLRISANNGATWGNDLNLNSLHSDKFAPITTGALAKNAALPNKFYAQPNYRQGAYSNWLTASDDLYAKFTILVKVNDGGGQTQIENDVYLTDVTIQDATTDGAPDLSKALRVHVAASDGATTKYFLFANSSTPGAEVSTSVGGKLDINNDNKYDTEGYEWSSQPIIYGEEGAVQTAYAADDSNIIAQEDQYGALTGGTPLGSTKESGYLSVTVTIWLEGWALLTYGVDYNTSVTSTINKTNTQIWDSTTYVNKKFNVGLSFGVDL